MTAEGSGNRMKSASLGLCLALFLLATCTSGCYWKVVVTNKAFIWESSILNVRVGTKHTRLDADGAIDTGQSNEKMSKEAADFGADCVEAFARGMAKGVCPVP